MSVSVKFRSHIEKVWRVKPDEQSRLEKMRLDKNERISPFPAEFWQKSLSAISQELVQAYPEVWPLYVKLSEFHGLTTDSFLLTAGSDAAIKHCFEVFVSPGAKVIYPNPTFAMVSIYGELYGAEKIAIGYDKNLNLRIEYLLGAIDEKTSLIILANPNSPTGTYVHDSILSEILKKAASFRIPVLIDEAYYGFCRHTALNLLKDYQNLIIARTFSKIAGMAGLRVGYAIGHPEVISLLTKFRPMYEVNSFGVVFAGKLLDNWGMAEKYAGQTVEGRNRFAAFLNNLGLPVINTEANFLHVDFGNSKKKVLDALEAEGILVRGTLSVNGYENYTRFSVGPWESMMPVVESIKKVLPNQEDALWSLK